MRRSPVNKCDNLKVLFFTLLTFVFVMQSRLCNILHEKEGPTGAEGTGQDDKEIWCH